MRARSQAGFALLAGVWSREAVLTIAAIRPWFLQFPRVCAIADPSVRGYRLAHA